MSLFDRDGLNALVSTTSIAAATPPTALDAALSADVFISRAGPDANGPDPPPAIATTTDPAPPEPATPPVKPRRNIWDWLAGR